MKFDQEKIDPPIKAWLWLWKVMRYGAKKYAPNNWKLVAKERYKKALLRHLNDYLSGDLIDSEEGGSGFPHLALLLTNVVFLIELELDEPGKKE